MRISMISEHASPLATLGGVDAGGQNVHVAALATELGERGHDVTVFTRKDSRDLPEAVNFADRVTVVNIAAGPEEPVSKDDLLPFMPDLGRGIAAYWGQHHDTIPDIVHSHFWMSGLAGKEALERSRLTRSPLVHTFHALGTVKRRHQGVLDTSPPDRAHLEPQVGIDAAHIIATCDDEVRELEAMGIDADKTSVVPCGVDLRVFRSDIAPEDTHGSRRIVSVGRLVARKGMDLTISALAHLLRLGYEDVELHIVGGGGSSRDLDDDPEALRLKEVAEELGVADRVVLRGQVPRGDMPRILRSASVVACTPWYEPFGIVPLEAMACGVPVVATKVGGLADTVVDGVTGLHVPPHAPKAIATAAALLLDDPQLARELGSNGAQRAHERYAWPQVAKATEEVYEQLLAARGAGSADGPLPAEPTDSFAEYDRVERARRRDRALREEEIRNRVAARLEEAWERQVDSRETGDDIHARRTQV